MAIQLAPSQDVPFRHPPSAFRLPEFRIFGSGLICITQEFFCFFLFVKTLWGRRGGLEGGESGILSVLESRQMASLAAKGVPSTSNDARGFVPFVRFYNRIRKVSLVLFSKIFFNLQRCRLSDMNSNLMRLLLSFDTPWMDCAGLQLSFTDVWNDTPDSLRILWGFFVDVLNLVPYPVPPAWT